jgi:hypothetical protein
MLNPGNDGFQMSLNGKFYVDKSMLISLINGQINTKDRFLCCSRPRRFGKTMSSEMLAAYYSCGSDSREMFSGLKIAADPSFEKHLNKYNVIFATVARLMYDAQNHKADPAVRFRASLIPDIAAQFPAVDVSDERVLSEILDDVVKTSGRKVVFIFDEWDAPFRETKNDEKGQGVYLNFLRNLLKDQDYVAAAYMTGILPIKKYGTHSALNMFIEYSMTTPLNMAEFIGFTSDEVQDLCNRFGMDYAEMEKWYDGYRLLDSVSGDTLRVFSPRSVASAVSFKRYNSYWTQTETYEALAAFIGLNYDGLREKVTALLAGEVLPTKTSGYQNDMTSFNSADDILTMLIHLGYLGYDELSEETFVPNKEISKEFVTAIEGNKWTEVIKAVDASKSLLKAAWNMDTDTVAGGIEEAHFETAHITYNSEAALSYVVSLAFYAAREHYIVVRELPTGKGFADMAFIPRPTSPDVPGMIIELKWDKTANTAIKQIEERKYQGALAGFANDILLIGISYDKETKKHECEIKLTRI